MCVVSVMMIVLTQVVMPRDENRAISSSKLIPPTPITSIMSAGLLRGTTVSGEGRGWDGREWER